VGPKGDTFAGWPSSRRPLTAPLDVAPHLAVDGRCARPAAAWGKPAAVVESLELPAGPVAGPAWRHRVRIRPAMRPWRKNWRQLSPACEGRCAEAAGVGSLASPTMGGCCDPGAASENRARQTGGTRGRCSKNSPRRYPVVALCEHRLEQGSQKHLCWMRCLPCWSQKRRVHTDFNQALTAPAALQQPIPTADYHRTR